MAEVFGVVSGAASIFTTCIEVFNHVSLGRRFGRDFETCQTRLSLVQLRLSRWGDAVRIYDDPKLGRPSATEEEVKQASDTLRHILQLFEDSNTVSKTFRLDSAQMKGLEPSTSQIGDALASMVVKDKIESLAARRQRSTGFRKLARWTIHDRKDLMQLVEDIISLVSDLEVLFPLPANVQSQLVSQEVSELKGEEENLLAAAKDTDKVLYKAVASKRVGHEYRGADIKGASAVMKGNLFAAGFTGTAPVGSSHLYDGVKISSDGSDNRTKVLMGDQFGGKGFFD